MTNEALLEEAIARLKRDGTIEYRGEYGAEITTFIPFVCWLKAEGLIEGRRVVSHAGMRPYYYFLEEDEFAEKSDLRAWVPVIERDWPGNSSYDAVRAPWHKMPDYRARYLPEAPLFARPLLFIQNKFCVEWNAGPVNYLPLHVLEPLFAQAGTRFDIVYSRPRRMAGNAGYGEDGNQDCDYPDLLLAGRYPAVTVLEDHAAAYGVPYNLAKLRILSRCHVSIAVQGGGAHLLACFGDALLLVYHREGPEYPHAYAHGPYKYLADPAPLLMVAQTSDQLVEGAAVVANVGVVDGRLQIGAQWRPLFDKLRV